MERAGGGGNHSTALRRTGNLGLAFGPRTPIIEQFYTQDMGPIAEPLVDPRPHVDARMRLAVIVATDSRMAACTGCNCGRSILPRYTCSGSAHVRARSTMLQHARSPLLPVCHLHMAEGAVFVVVRINLATLHADSATTVHRSRGL